MSKIYLSDREISVATNKKVSNNLDNKRILIAEDNSVNMLLSKILINSILPNAEIIEASSGIAAIEYCKKNKVDLIYMDIQMPDLNGYEVTQILRNELKIEIPILALTAGTIKGEAEKCISAGMNDFISKPVSESDIYNSLKKWLKIDLNYKSTENKTAKESVVFDINILMSYVDNDEEIVAELINSTKIVLLECFQELDKIDELKDLKIVESINHKLISMSKATGLVSLHELIKRFIDDKDDETLFLGYIENLKNEIKKAIESISKL